METKKYLDYEGLITLSTCLKNIRTSDKLDVLEALNDIAESIGNGKLTISINNVKAIEFTANLSNNDDINISVPTSLNDFNDAVNIIKNIIKYGLSDVSTLSEEEKNSLHNLTAENSGFVSEDLLENALTNYGTIINYDSATLKIQLKNGNTILSEFSAADFIKDSMILDISVTNGTGNNAGKRVLLIDFNTDSGITDIEIPISEIFDSDNYYTKLEVDNKITESGTFDPSLYYTKNDINNAGYLTSHLSLTDYALKSELFSGSYNDLTDTPSLFNGTYSDLSYTVNTEYTNASGNLEIDFSTNIYKIIATGNISSLIFTGVPENNHSCHIIIKINNSEGDNTIITLSNGAHEKDGNTYTLICPNNEDLILTGTNGSYLEFDILRIDNELFVRGI